MKSAPSHTLPSAARQRLLSKISIFSFTFPIIFSADIPVFPDIPKPPDVPEALALHLEIIRVLALETFEILLDAAEVALDVVRWYDGFCAFYQFALVVDTIADARGRRAASVRYRQ